MTFEEELLTILNQIPGAIEKAFTAFVERHPGHANQKTHGNRFGAGQAKESLRRLKDDKGAREEYKQRAREKTVSAETKTYLTEDIEYDLPGLVSVFGEKDELVREYRRELKRRKVKEAEKQNPLKNWSTQDISHLTHVMQKDDNVSLPFRKKYRQDRVKELKKALPKVTNEADRQRVAGMIAKEQREVRILNEAIKRNPKYK